MKRFFVVALALTLGTLVATASFAQIPDTYTNLKFLPKDIKKQQLMQTMRGFNKALGVKCYFCHKGEQGQPLSTFDFASDENKHKVIARTMVTMTQEINNKHLKGLGSKDNPAKISCHTCHLGNKKPETKSE